MDSPTTVPIGGGTATCLPVPDEHRQAADVRVEKTVESPRTGKKWR